MQTATIPSPFARPAPCAHRLLAHITRSPDDVLVARARAGDPCAFGQLVERHRPEIYRHALRMEANRSDAEEIVQETFLHAFRALAAYRGQASFRTWLYRIALRAVLVRRRAARRRPTEPLTADPPHAGGSPLAPGGASQPTRADDLLERKELAQTLGDALDRLGGAYRPVVQLRDLEDRSSGDAARALGLSNDVVRQRLRRAHLMLRSDLARARGALSASPSAS
jgi:RNA polymerase sigma-70 factor (ECF subfamily)